MSAPHAEGWTRRAFLGGVALAGTAGLLRLPSTSVAAEPPPETTTLRVVRSASVCVAPEYVAETLLHGEGFAAVHYVKPAGTSTQALASGAADLSTIFVGPLLLRVDAGDPVVLLAGGHVGCFELFGGERVRTVQDLRGKTVAVPGLESSHHLFLAGIAAYVGLDPHKDIVWVTHPPAEAMRLLAAGQIDAYAGFPPDPQALRAQKVGRLIVSTAVDRPWSQYFSCMVAANREFVRTHPVATKRALRAFLRAADICSLEPDQTARFLVEKGYAQSYDYALQTMQEIPYGKWHEYSPEDAVRFYALRLHEIGMIKSSPRKILAQGTDWSFVNELKKELKG